MALFILFLFSALGRLGGIARENGSVSHKLEREKRSPPKRRAPLILSEAILRR
jgi:hypothetical protein